MMRMMMTRLNMSWVVKRMMKRMRERMMKQMKMRGKIG
jgi:hypothetical protein